MNYEQKYKETISKARECMKDGGISQNTIDYLCNIFPELQGYDDERIRKEIISLLQYTKGRRIGYEPRISQDDMIAWLEKQGEQKPFDYENATMTQKDFSPNGMTDSQYLDRAVCYIEEREKDDDYICNKLYGIKPEREICCKDCQGLLDRTCVLRFLKYYKKGGKE